jgi:hypothetical protein
MVNGPSNKRKYSYKFVFICLGVALVYLFLVVLVILAKEQHVSRPSLQFLRQAYRNIDIHAIYNISRPQPRALVASDSQQRDFRLDSSNYPSLRPLLTLLQAWKPDEPDLPIGYKFQETLQHFNYSSPVERAMAEAYRNAELPFKLYGVPDIDSAGSRWNDVYLIEHMDEVTAHIEESSTNHFMFWKKSKSDKDPLFDSPTTIVDMKFRDWLSLARDADIHKIPENATHYYYMLGVSADDQSFVNRDLQLFNAKAPNFFITNTDANKGIQCRFGMRGIIAEAHFDSGRNMVAMIRGAKRYILVPPNHCQQLHIIADPSHPSYRHSEIDWSNLDQAREHDFMHIPAIDTIVQQGEVLYIPSFWFHYIISLQYSIQCNSRSGTPPNNAGESDIDRCFGGALHAKGKKKLAGVAPQLNR